jgi:type VI secretion system VasD/TssJ family lipoprotein
MLLSGAGSLSCRHAPAPAPGPRTAVQVLIQAGAVLNPGDDGQPWPTAVTHYQLRGDPKAPEHPPLDSSIVLSRGDAAFGELLLERREYTAFPDTRARVVVPLGPETTHLVAVAHFREPLGDAALLVFPVPDAAATTRTTHPADPCLYLGLERSELDGGPFPPPGFDPAAFATTCPPPAAPKQPVPSDSNPAPVPEDSPSPTAGAAP